MASCRFRKQLRLAAIGRSIRAVEIQTVLTRVRADVIAATDGKHVPWSNSSLLGEVYLAK